MAKFKAGDKLIDIIHNIHEVYFVTKFGYHLLRNSHSHAYSHRYVENNFELVQCGTSVDENITINGDLQHIYDAYNQITLAPDEEWIPELPCGEIKLPPIDDTKPVKNCTCGISAIGGGMHSDWCDLYEGPRGD